MECFAADRTPRAASEAQHGRCQSGFFPWNAVEKANSGHPGMPMGWPTRWTSSSTASSGSIPSRPDWPDRDRFVLSAGHGSMLLYSLHHSSLCRYAMAELLSFRQLGSKTAGHPEYGHALGIETTTDRWARDLDRCRHGDRRTDDGRPLPAVPSANHFTYVVAGDAVCRRGISHEGDHLADI